MSDKPRSLLDLIAALEIQNRDTPAAETQAQLEAYKEAYRTYQKELGMFIRGIERWGTSVVRSDIPYIEIPRVTWEAYKARALFTGCFSEYRAQEQEGQR